MEEYKLIVIKNPLLPQERETSVITLIPGKSILYYRKEHLPLDIDFIVFVNGEIISDDVLDTIFLQQNDVVIFKPKIEDPFTLAALAMIALSVAAWSVPIMLGVAGITAAIISAGIMIVGGLLISALMPVPDINSPNMTKEGATYSWSGPLNTQNQGIAIPVVYGKIRTGGNIIASHTTNDGDKQYLSALICPSMGPIHSISEIELNKQPIANFGATVDTRLGTIPQTVITYFEDTLETFDYDVLLANNVSHTYTTDGSEFNGLQFDITFPKGLQYIEDNGDKNNFSVTIQIEIKKTVGGSWSNFYYGGITGNSRNPVRRTFVYTVPTGQKGKYDVRITRRQQERNDDYHLEEAHFTSIREVYGDDFQYPGLSLISIRALATDNLSGQFTLTGLVEGRKVRQYSGSWSTSWTDNPAWICYDILTFPIYDSTGNVNRYEYINPSRIDTSSFQTWAAFCNQMVDDGEGGTRKRYKFNGAFDSGTNMWEAALQVAMESQATLIFEGTKIRAIVDTLANPIQLFTMGNIAQGSFKGKFLGLEDRAGQIDITFMNSRKNYEMDTISVYSSNLLVDPSNKASITLRGCTDSAQAWAFAMYRLRCNNYLTESASIDVNIDSLISAVGDVILLQHDVPILGSGGRLAAVTDSSTLVLDREVIMQSPQTYKVKVRTSNDTIQERNVVFVDGTSTTIKTTAVFSPVPAQYDIYAFYEVGTNKEVKSYKIAGVSPGKDFKRTLDLIEYNANIYDLGTPIIVPDTTGDPVVISPVLNLALSETAYINESGIIIRYIEATFDKPNNPQYKMARIYIREYPTGTWRLAGETVESSFRIYDVLHLTQYEVLVVSVTWMGLQTTFTQSPSALITTGYIPDYEHEFLNKKVSGLHIFGQGNNTEFVGRDCRFVWNDITIDDAGLIADPNYPAGSHTPSVWFKDYEVIIKSSDGIIRRTEYVTEPRYTYSYEKNYDDGNSTTVRTFIIEVKARDRYYRKSLKPAKLTVSNPAPDYPINVSVIGYIEAIDIKFYPSIVPDLVGYLIYASQTPGFSPSESNLINRGTESSFIMTNVTGTWYIRIAGYDTFGEDALNYTPEYSATAASVPVEDTTPPEVPTGLALTTGILLGNDGSEFAWINGDWNDNTDSDISYYRSRLKETGGNYNYATSPVSNYMFVPVRAGVLHHFGVQAVDKSNNASAFTTDSTTTAALDTTPPSAPSGLTATSSFKHIFLKWTNPADYDFASTEIWRADGTNNRLIASMVAKVKGTSYADEIGTYNTTKYYWVRAQDWSRNYSGWYPDSTTAGIGATTAYVGTTDINDFAINESKMFTWIPILTGGDGVWHNDTPDTTSISWDTHTLYYDGTGYSITASNTYLKYVYWMGGTSYVKDSTNRTLTDGQFIIATNVMGTHDLAWKAIANEVIGTAYIQDAAITNAKIESLTADKITAGYLSADRIEANSLILDKLAIGSFHNLIEDSDLETGTAGLWTYNSGWERWGADAYSGIYCARKTGNGVANNFITTRYTQVFPGEKYLFRAWVKSSAVCGGNINLRIRWYKIDKTASTTAYTTTVITLPNMTYAEYSVTGTAPSDAAFCKFSVESTTGIIAGQYVYVDFLQASRMVGTVYIEDGAITTDKLFADSVTADKIAAGAITAESIAVGDFENMAVEGDFESSGSYVDNWTNQTKFSWTNETPGQSGNYCVKSPAESSAVITYTNKYFRCNYGEQVYYRGWVKNTADYTSSASQLYMYFYDASLNALGAVRFKGITNSTTWTMGEMTEQATDTSTCYVRVGLRRGSAGISGTAYFDNLYAKKLTGYTLIEDGAIRTGHLDATCVTAGKLVGNQAVITGTAQIANAIINDAHILDLDGGKINANSITANKLLISSFSNMVDDPGFEENSSLWVYGTGWDRTTGNSYTGNWHAKFIAQSADRSLRQSTRKWECNPGEEMYLSAMMKSDATANGNVQLEMVWLTADGTAVSTTGSSVISLATITSYTKCEYRYNAPALARKVSFNIQAQSNMTQGKLYVDDVEFRRTTGSTYIEDGAITTDKIFTGAVTADKIDAHAITADRVLVGDFEDLAPDGDFEGTFTDNWDNSTAYTEETSIVQSGLKSVKRAVPTGVKLLTTKKYFRARPGDMIYASAWSRTSADVDAATSAATLRVMWYSASDLVTPLQTDTVSWDSGIQTTWVEKTLTTAVAPANTCYVRVGVRTGIHATGGGYFYFDNIMAKKLKGSVLIEDGAIIAGKISVDAITAAGGEIANLAVSTLKVQNQAITIPINAETAGDTGYLTDAAWNTIQSCSITSTGQPIFIFCSFNLKDAAGNGFDIRILRDSTGIYTTGQWIMETPSQQYNLEALSTKDITSSGSHTYYLQVYPGSAYVSCKNRIILLLEVKK